MRGFFLSLILAGVVTASASAPSRAADIMSAPPPPPMAAPAWTWTGFYIGANAGYGWTSTSASFTNGPIPSGGGLASLLGPGNPVSFDAVNGLGGVQIGFDWQIASFMLIGIETDFDFTNLRGSNSASNTSLIVSPFTSTAEQRVQWFGTVRGRVGFLPWDNLLIYATGGFAHGGVKQDVAYNDNGNGVADQDGNCNVGPGACYTGSSSRIAIGWAAGGGLEYAFWRHWSVRAEYLFIDLGAHTFNETVPSSNTPGIPPSTMVAHFNETELQVLRAGVNFRF
jgi:outer membrane immunogenic protein